MKNESDWCLRFKSTAYFDAREITLRDSKTDDFDTELLYELSDDGTSVTSFKIYNLYNTLLCKDICTQFDITELPKLIKELEAAYKRYKDFKEND